MHRFINVIASGCLALLLVIPVQQAFAAADLEVNTPEIAALKNSMQNRHQQLEGFYDSGAIGLTDNGKIAVKDAKAAELKDRGRLQGLVSEENADRDRLYAAIAKANGHPEWQADIQSTFAKRWIDKARTGWFFQQSGGWAKK